MNPRVSVVIATYNYGRYLGGAINSVLAQTFHNFEIIIVDDGSTDDTPGVVKPFLADSRVRYHRTEHHGQPQTKNEGIRQSRGELIAFLDADDLWLPVKLERQIDLFDRDPELGVACCYRKYIDEEGFELDKTQREHFRGYVLPKMFWRNFVCFSSSMVRREVFDDVGLFDEQYPLAIDYELWLRVARKYRFDYVDVPLVKYRSGHANLSRRSYERVFIVRSIMGRFLNDANGKDLLPGWLIRLAFAEHWCDTAAESNRRTAAAFAFLRALAYRPIHLPAWHGLLTVWWPEAVKVLVRRLLGRPNWSIPRRLEPQETPANLC